MEESKCRVNVSRSEFLSWEDCGENGPYGRDVSVHRVDELDQLALKRVSQLCAVNTEVHVADIGSGSNLWFAREAAKLGATVYAIDRIPLAAADAELPPNLQVLCETLPDEISRLAALPRFHVIYSQRMFHYIAPSQHNAMWNYLNHALRPRGELFISISGLDSELGVGYSASEMALENRFAVLEEKMAKHHSIFAPVCLFRAEEVAEALSRHGFEAVQVETSQFGNIKAMARKARSPAYRPARLEQRVGEVFGSARFIRHYLSQTSTAGDYYRQAQINPVIRRLLTTPSVDWPGLETAYDSELVEPRPSDAALRGDILDIGCGSGYRAFLFSGDYRRYLGIDAVRAFTDAAQARQARTRSAPNAHFFHMRAEQVSVRWLRQGLGGTPDLVLMIVFAEYLHDGALVRLLRTLRAAVPRGKRQRLLMVTCNPQFYRLRDTAQTQLVETFIQSAGQSVLVYVRGLVGFRKLFALAGIDAVEHARFSVSPRSTILRPDMPIEGLETSQSPFDFWLLQLSNS
jgi:SAM-dependent methyltransferase